MFILPSLMLMTVYMMLVKRYLVDKNYKDNILIYLPIFTSPILFVPTMVGYIGSVGLVFIAFSLLIIYKEGEYERSLWDYIALSITVVTLLMTRRWYLFYVFTMFVAWGSLYVIYFIRARKIKLEMLKDIVITTFIIFLTLLILFKPYVFRVVFNDFNDAYSAYQNGDLWFNFQQVLSRFGGLYIVLSIIGMYYSFKDKKTEIISFYFVVQLIVLFIMFTSIQSFGTHHMYLLYFQVVYFTIVGLIKLDSVMKRRTVVSLVATLSVINLGITFFPNGNEVVEANPFAEVVLTDYYQPVINDDSVENIKDLASYLHDLTADGSYVYLNSSSAVLNPDMVRNANLPYILNSVPNLEPASVVDKRDGFPKDFHRVRYVVLVEPNMYNMGIENQQVMKLISDGIKNEDSVSKHYKKINEISLNLKDINIVIYERISNLDGECELFFENNLKEVYSDYAYIYELDFTY
jgi:hypothetical protein